jgi:hypothetical protein
MRNANKLENADLANAYRFIATLKLNARISLNSSLVAASVTSDPLKVKDNENVTEFLKSI